MALMKSEKFDNDRQNIVRGSDPPEKTKSLCNFGY